MKAFIHYLFSVFGLQIIRTSVFSDQFVKKNEIAHTYVKADSALESEFFEIMNSIELLNKNLDTPHGGVTSYTLFCAIQYLLQNKIQGDIIECGVYDGNKMLLAMEYLFRHDCNAYQVYLYDTFAGMTEPSEKDYAATNLIDYYDAEAVKQKHTALQESEFNRWCYVSEEKVRENIKLSSYSPEKVTLVRGDVRETLKKHSHKQIALLRLDTDFYDSSLAELKALYDYVVPGGVIIFDDYGGWAGQQQATSEFIAELEHKPLLVRTNQAERVMIKVK